MARLIVGYAAIASALPYLALKIVWLAGGTLGVANQDLMRDASMRVLNGVTAGMDVVAIGLALAFTHRWGLAMPAWLLLPPMWVASGLLATFVVGVPIAMIDALMSGGLPRASGGPVQPWVYLVVYTEFAGLGIGLMAAFFLYARRRWADVLEPPARAIAPGATHGVQVVLANASAIVMGALGVAFLAQAFGAATIIGSIMRGIDAALFIGAAAGVLMIVHGYLERVPFWVAVTMTWLGSGAAFGWGTWRLINVLGHTALMRDAAPMPVLNLVCLLRMIVGVVLGLLIVFALTERRARLPEIRP